MPLKSIYFNGGFIGVTTPYQLASSVAAAGEQAYTTPGTYSWTCPEGVTSVCVVAVGGGGGGTQSPSDGSGGGGGGLGYKNNITVVPGNSYDVVVGSVGARGGSSASGGGDSYFIDTSTVKGGGGSGAVSTETGGSGGTYTGDGGGNGGRGGNGGGSNADAGGGGGAGGYSGDGGQGGDRNTAGSSGSGGGGGGGGAGGSSDSAGGGGGVGIGGQGSNGAGGSYGGGNGGGGGGGSDGANGTNGDAPQGDGGNYGGGGGGADNTNNEHGNGAGGAVRIIWGSNRAFPSTNTADGQGDPITINSNSGIFNLQAVFDGLPRAYDYEAKYGTANYTITSIPSTAAGVTNSNDVLIAVDANFATTDDGVIFDLGGNSGSGFSAGLLNGNLRVRAFNTTGDSAWNTDAGAAEVEVDITSYCGSNATYYFVVDQSVYNLKVFVQPGGKGSSSEKVFLGSDTADGSETRVYGSAGKGYGQVNSNIADLTASYEVTYNGSGITEIRYWAEGITTIDTSNFEAENG